MHFASETQATVQSELLDHVHYYEQGNVHMEATHKAEAEVAGKVDPDPSVFLRLYGRADFLIRVPLLTAPHRTRHWDGACSAQGGARSEA